MTTDQFLPEYSHIVLCRTGRFTLRMNFTPSERFYDGKLSSPWHILTGKLMPLKRIPQWKVTYLRSQVCVSMIVLMTVSTVRYIYDLVLITTTKKATQVNFLIYYLSYPFLSPAAAFSFYPPQSEDQYLQLRVSQSQPVTNTHCLSQHRQDPDTDLLQHNTTVKVYQDLIFIVNYLRKDFTGIIYY